MATIEIPGELHARLTAFKPVVEAVIEETMSFEDFVALLLDQALAAMFSDLLKGLDETTMLQSFHQLAARHPAEVYGFVGDVLAAGASTIDRETMRRRIGFHTSDLPDLGG
jgi:hypothetical protein